MSTKKSKETYSKVEEETFLLQEAHNSFDYLQKLAKELSLNYVNASIYDLVKLNENIKSEQNRLYYSLRNDILTHKFSESSKFTRNILVVGAGCTTNAFSDMPLGSQAVSRIESKIIIDKEKDLTFKDFSNHIFNSKSDKTLDEETIKKLNTILSEDKHILSGISKKYKDSYAKLKLYSTDQDHNSEIDFETSLNLLASVLPHSTVRQALHDLFNYKYGTIPFYEIVAHLFKHRFIDVIINFNFDEFLDEALEEELGSVSYDSILSDGDCRDFDLLGENGRLRQPLYIKPHGTASHKSTLRFTKDHYYELPTDLRILLEKVISVENAPKDEQHDRSVNLITVGFDMGSLEFNEILRKNLPTNSKIFTFYYHKANEGFESKEGIYEKITSRIKKLNDLFEKKEEKDSLKNKPSIFPIGHEFFISGKQLYNREFPFALKEENTSLGNTFEVLFHFISNEFSSLYKPQEIYRHKLLANIFGNTDFWSQANNSTNSNYPKYFKTSDYFKDRVLIEILINLCHNKGRVDPPLLMEGRTGKYYDLYYKKCREDVEKVKQNGENKDIEKPLTIIQLLNFIFAGKEVHPLKMEFQETLFIQKFDITFPYFYSLTQNNNKFFSENLEKRFFYLKKEGLLDDLIYRNFRGIVKSNRSIINSDFRGKVYHVFENYSQRFLLNTELAIDVQFLLSCRKETKVNTLLMVSENGFSLAKFIPHIFQKKIKVFLFLADRDTAKKDIEEKKSKARNNILTNWNPQAEIPEGVKDYFEKNLEINFLEINRHNHHMMIFLNSCSNADIENVKVVFDKIKTNRAVYYYQKGLNQKINPLMIFEKNNIAALIEKFKAYSKSAIQYEKISI